MDNIQQMDIRHNLQGSSSVHVVDANTQAS